MSRGNFLSKACFAVLTIVLSLTFVSCNKDDDGEKINPDNLFVGTWLNGDVTVVFTENTWTAKNEGSFYNSGTYTYEGNTAQCKVTNKGIGSANVGNTGSATISDNKMTVSGFIDENMNGQYTKKKEDVNGDKTKLVSRILDNNNGITEFFYDTQNRLTKISVVGNYEYRYSYEKDTITVVLQYDESIEGGMSQTAKVVLNDKSKIVSFKDYYSGEGFVEYDNDGYLKRIVNDGYEKNTQEYIRTDDNITTINWILYSYYSGKTYTSTIRAEYGDDENLGYFDMNWFFRDDYNMVPMFMLYHLYGKYDKNLVTKTTDNLRSNTSTYEYKFDSGGYVTECTKITQRSSGTYSTVYKIEYK